MTVRTDDGVVNITPKVKLRVVESVAADASALEDKINAVIYEEQICGYRLVAWDIDNVSAASFAAGLRRYTCTLEFAYGDEWTPTF